MNSDFKIIKNLFNELDYYEKNGLYKLSDNVLNKIQKYAFNFNSDAVFPGLATKLKMLNFTNACDFPECRPFFCDKSGGKFLAVKDFTNYIAEERSKNPSKSIEELKAEYDMTAAAKLGGVQLSKEDEEAFSRCLEKIGLQSPSNPNAKLGTGENLTAAEPIGSGMRENVPM